MQVTLASHRSPDATSTDVAALHADTCDLGHPGSPSATVRNLRDQRDAVDCLVLGDTTILLEEPGIIRVITDDRLEHVAALQHGAMHQHTTGSADHDRSFAELVTEQRRHRNRPDGFWVASTDPSAAQHALTDTVPVMAYSERPRAATPTGDAGRVASDMKPPPPDRTRELGAWDELQP